MLLQANELSTTVAYLSDSQILTSATTLGALFGGMGSGILVSRVA